MAIINHDDWSLSEKGKQDRARHNEKVDDAIRKSVRDVIAEESIITKRKDRTIRIPVRSVREWRFIHGRNSERGGGAGQGDGKPGDIIARKKLDDGSGQGAGGKDRGADIIEVDVKLDYLIEIMFDELGLPFIKDKNTITQYLQSGFKFDSISKKGIFPLLHKHRTITESIKRHVGLIREIIEATNCDDDDAYRACTQANYDVDKAIQIILSGQVDMSIDPDTAPFIDDEDLRFKQIDDKFEPHSNAVVILMCDSSGSMTKDKKYIMRGFFFWLTEFIRKCYDHVEVRFITHTTEAQLVDEDEFFRKGESGGTNCHTAFDLANYLLDTEYPTDKWNAYVLYASDGEDFNVGETVTSINTMLAKDVNMISYCEVRPGDERHDYGQGELLEAIVNALPLKKVKQEDKLDFYKNNEKRFYAGVLTDIGLVWPYLKFILFAPRNK